MYAKQNRKEEAIYHAALSKLPNEREVYMQNACRGDAALLARVQALLRARELDDGFLEEAAPGLGMACDGVSIAEGPGTIIGRYKLLEKIGEGGMAVVYMAEQERPIRRTVGLKIIKPGMDTKQVIARFEVERQALALMDHPNIAKVLDAGATDTGRPFFVMELVKGISITEYCDQNQLSIRERLALFNQVCNAVQHAHQKGIIHRDLKPSNVMVALHDHRAVPKVIDFGIAKATNQRLTEKTLFTRYAQMIGTPVYMSPEQAEFSDLDVDTRTDIYSLGVLLYELLTGTPPFDEEELREAGYLEMQRVIREEEPVKPSTKLSTLSASLTDIAKQRRSTPEMLRKTVRGDLDWIVMKTLEKDRTRRYETANALRLDIHRHLASEPVLAGPPSTLYRLRKFMRKYRTRLAVSAAILAAAAICLVLTILYVRAEREQRTAQQEVLAKEQALAQQQRQLQTEQVLSAAQTFYAQGQYQQALSTVDTLVQDPCAPAEATLLQAKVFFAMDQLDAAQAKLNGLLGEAPVIAGAAHSLLARILSTTNPARARQHQEHAEALQPQTAEAYSLRTITAATPDEAIDWLSQALDLDPGHYPSRKGRALVYYGLQDYDNLDRDVEAMIVARPQDALGYGLRAILRRQTGQLDQALVDHDRAIQTCEVQTELAEHYNQRRETHVRIGNPMAALADARQCVELAPEQAFYRFQVFASLVALEDYEAVRQVHLRMATRGLQGKFRAWSKRRVFKILAAGQTFSLPSALARDEAFSPMQEAADYYRVLESKATRLAPHVSGQCSWSPDGKEFAFGRPSLVVHNPTTLATAAPARAGSSGIEILNLNSRTTRLLVGFGFDPAWSPDGRHIIFVCRPFGTLDAQKELWIISAAGGQPRRLTAGAWPMWACDSRRVFFHSHSSRDPTLYCLDIADPTAEPIAILACPGWCPAVSPDEQYVAYGVDRQLYIVRSSSGAVVSTWTAPGLIRGMLLKWSPDGRELGIGGLQDSDLGLWIFDVASQEARHVLDAPASDVFWSWDGSQIAIGLGCPLKEVWLAERDPKVSTCQAFTTAQTVEDFLRDRQRQYTGRVDTHPSDTRVIADKLLVTGIDQFRVGAYADSLATMACLDSLPSGGLDRESRTRVAAFRALALHRLGRHHEAKHALARVGSRFRPGRSATQAFTFGTPTKMPHVNSPSIDKSPSISSDGLSLYFTSSRPYAGDWSHLDIWVATREATDAEWGTPVKLDPPVNSPACEANPSVSADGLELYFCDGIPLPSSRPAGFTHRPGGNGWGDLWVSTRATTDSDWGQPRNLGPLINTYLLDGDPEISVDGLALFFHSRPRPGGHGSGDLWVTTRTTKSDPWGPPVNLGPAVNSRANDYGPEISSDGLWLFFYSSRPGGYGGYDLYGATRATVSDPWGPPVNLGPAVNTAMRETNPSLSANGSMLYFTRRQSALDGDCNLWQVPVLGVVDRDEIKTEDVDKTHLVAHWKLDENTDGSIHDSVSLHEGKFRGNLIWQPTEGRSGALKFQALGTYVVTDFVVNPAQGPFSVFVRIKGGRPGQVILSQTDGTWWGSTWLGMDPAQGTLLTGLTEPQAPLVSDGVITDGQWHHIGLVWDGMHRHLYVDGVRVAEDTTTITVIPSDGGLHLGAGKALARDEFFSGLIDDIRIYEAALTPEQVADLAQE